MDRDIPEMKQLFLIDMYSDFGPQVSYIKVDVDGSTAYITDFDQETTEVQFTSVEELIKFVRNNYEYAFMTVPETTLTIEADLEIEPLLRRMLWECQA